MNNTIMNTYLLDYVEIYTPMAKALTYWHTQALGFVNTAYSDYETGKTNGASFVLESDQIRLVLTSASLISTSENNDVTSYISHSYYGAKKLALRVSSVKDAFEKSIANGAFPLKFPGIIEDELGYVEEASIKLFDNCEIAFINRDFYNGAFKPGYRERKVATRYQPLMNSIDHVASEVRINESKYWTEYLAGTLGTKLVQCITENKENQTGMILNISQTSEKNLTFVIAEPSLRSEKSKVQNNIDTFGPGIHHLAFATDDIIKTIAELRARGVEFVTFPNSYYDLLRGNPEFGTLDIDGLQENGLIVDKEGDSHLLQKFLKPIGDRPYFFYEIVQRANGYAGFALRNINMLKKAEELEILKHIGD